MKYYKVIENDKIIMLGKSKAVPKNGVEITETEYNTLYAEIKIHIEMVMNYVAKVQNGVITLDDVPAEYYDEVYAIINAPEPVEPDPMQEFVDELIAEVNA